MKKVNIGFVVLSLMLASSISAESWSVLLTGFAGEKDYSKRMSQTWFFEKSQTVSEWNLGSSEPPLGIHKATVIAEKAFRTSIKDSEFWSLGDEIRLKQIYPGLAYYHFTFKGDFRKKEHMDLIVFMDGSISAPFEIVEQPETPENQKVEQAVSPKSDRAGG